MAVDAVIRNYEVIGEATKNIPEEIKEKYPEVEWKEATGFRDVLIHDYFDSPLFPRHSSQIIYPEYLT